MARESNIINDADYIASVYRKFPEVLQQLGFSSLRKGQDQVVASIVSGKDTIAILPTGTGKTACYVVPTLAQNMKTLIFSPLVALIQDQWDSLKRKGLKAGQLSSLQTGKENELTMSEWENGDLNFMLSAPERFNNEAFMNAITNNPPDMIVLDEAHCLSEWGDNFRADYVKVGEVVEKINPDIVLTLTATCPPSVESDIRRVLNLGEANKVCYLPKRENLIFDSKQWKSDLDLLHTINAIKGPTIIYASTVAEVERLYNSIGRSVEGDSLIFHGQLTPAEKASNLQMFMNDHAQNMFATTAFGMGIDKPNIRGVIQRSIPQSVEAAVQQFGRGGRDGLNTDCIFYWDQASEETQLWFLEMGYPTKSELISFLTAAKTKADQNGMCTATLNDICTSANLNPRKAQAIMEILTGHNVVQRAAKENFFKVKIMESHADKRMQGYIDKIEELGVPCDNDFYEVELDLFKDEIGKGMPTVKKNLKILDEEGYIIYTPPPKGKPMLITGKIDDIDFARLKKKEVFAYKKLDDLRLFYNTPDDQKHDFVNEYFTTE
jgi:ATP-dependent DNA helicase RecQ